MSPAEARLSQENKRPAGSPLLVVCLLGIVLLLLLLRSRPPSPVPATALATEFSGERARQVLKRLVGDGIPHPSGSQQNDVVRGRVVEELKNAGYEPSIQSGISCDEYGDCGTVQNVVARLEGTEQGDSVLVAAHYDSVAAGPGASDDGVGAASVIEIARALKARNLPRHPVVILIDDGEEAGLLGARVFVASHPWAKDIRAAVNLDNRGTSGPALMFETGSANDWVLKLYAKAVTRPATSSIYYAAYKQLPNDTDFTVFKAAGYQGVNFAIIGDEPHYHSQLDNFANASPASLQDEGADGLAMASALANANIAAPPISEAAYFDLLNRWTMVWPVRKNLRVAIAALVLLILLACSLVYRKRLGTRAIVWGLLYFPVTIAVVGGGVFLLRRMLRVTGAQPVDWIAHPLPALVAFWAFGIALVFLFALAFAKRAGSWGLWVGVWFWWLALAIVAALLLPGLGYLFLAPSCVAVVAAIPACLQRDESEMAVFVGMLLPLFVAAVLGFGLVLSLYPALGVVSFVIIALNVGILLTPIGPILARFKNSGDGSVAPLAAIALLVCAGAAFLAFVVPAYSAKSPEHLNIEYFQDADSGRSQWVLWPESGRLLRAAPRHYQFSSRQALLPLGRNNSVLCRRASPRIRAPNFHHPRVFGTEWTPDLSGFAAIGARGARDTAVLFPPDSGIENVSMETQAIRRQTEEIRRVANGWYHFECSTMPAKGVELEFSLPKGRPLTVTAIDQDYSLPLEGSFLVKARPFTATAFGNGDRTIVARHVQLLP